MATRRIPPMDDEDTDWESVTAAPWRVSPIPLEPPGQHHPEDEPDTCAEAALHELAGAKMSGEERQQTLDHGLRAVHELVRQLREARHWARLAWLLADTEEMVDPPAWLTGPPEDDPTWRGGASGQPHVARTVTGMSDDEQPVGEWAEDENGYSQEFSDWANRSMESYRARRLAAFQEDVVEGLRQSGQTGPLPDDLLEDRAADESLEFEFDEDTQIRPADLGSVLQGPPPSAGKVRQASEDAYGSWSWQHADDEEPPQEPSS
ncbi:hypothetical protein [uncultured Friedmanniella sp.]|uniref:hypothetical protein n=1 Tax=uncultured Friedmanniella sp. TaxID=335381 RepID=UPI0035CA3A74